MSVYIDILHTILVEHYLFKNKLISWFFLSFIAVLVFLTFQQQEIKQYLI